VRWITHFVLAFLLLGVVVRPATADQQPEPRPRAASSSKGRWIGLAIGAGAGFAAGLLLGLNQFDDAINSDRKVWTAVIVGVAGGGAAGFFIGKAIDRGQPRIVRQPLPVPERIDAAALMAAPCSVRLGCPQR
jgi:hypothetical protein